MCSKLSHREPITYHLIAMKLRKIHFNKQNSNEINKKHSTQFLSYICYEVMGAHLVSALSILYCSNQWCHAIKMFWLVRLGQLMAIFCIMVQTFIVNIDAVNHHHNSSDYLMFSYSMRIIFKRRPQLCKYLVNHMDDLNHKMAISKQNIW